MSSKLLPYKTKNQVEAGCDEAGRGCLAGPVVAAAVILPKSFKNELLNDNSPSVVNAAINSVSYILLPDYIPLLIEKLKRPETEKSAISTLKNYGKAALNILSDTLNHELTDNQTKKNIIEIVGNIGDIESVNTLFSAMENEDYWLQKDILKALNNLRKNYPLLKFDWSRIVKKLYEEVKLELEIISSLYLQTKIEKKEITDYPTEQENKILLARRNLISLLESRMDAGLERIFRLLGLKYPPDDMIEIFNSIQSSKQDLRTNAVDFLDNLLDVNLKKLIIPLIELRISDKLSKEILAQYKLKIPQETESFEELLYSKDNQFVLTTIKLIILSEKKELFQVIEKIKETSPYKSIIEKTLSQYRQK